MFKAADIVTLCVFRSIPENIAMYGPSIKGEDSFALSDKKGKVFVAYNVPKSTRAMITGTGNMMKNFGRFKKGINFSGMMRDARPSKMAQLPADFMIDQNGVIVDLFRSENMMEHMPFDRIEAFIPGEKRCRCNKKDCIVSYLVLLQKCECLCYVLSHLNSAVFLCASGSPLQGEP